MCRLYRWLHEHFALDWLDWAHGDRGFGGAGGPGEAKAGMHGVNAWDRGCGTPLL